MFQPLGGCPERFCAMSPGGNFVKVSSSRRINRPRDQHREFPRPKSVPKMASTSLWATRRVHFQRRCSENSVSGGSVSEGVSDLWVALRRDFGECPQEREFCQGSSSRKTNRSQDQHRELLLQKSMPKIASTSLWATRRVHVQRRCWENLVSRGGCFRGVLRRVFQTPWLEGPPRAR